MYGKRQRQVQLLSSLLSVYLQRVTSLLVGSRQCSLAQFPLHPIQTYECHFGSMVMRLPLTINRRYEYPHSPSSIRLLGAYSIETWTHDCRFYVDITLLHSVSGECLCGFADSTVWHPHT